MGYIEQGVGVIHEPRDSNTGQAITCDALKGSGGSGEEEAVSGARVASVSGSIWERSGDHVGVNLMSDLEG